MRCLRVFALKVPHGGAEFECILVKSGGRVLDGEGKPLARIAVEMPAERAGFDAVDLHRWRGRIQLSNIETRKLHADRSSELGAGRKARSGDGGSAAGILSGVGGVGARDVLRQEIELGSESGALRLVPVGPTTGERARREGRAGDGVFAAAGRGDAGFRAVDAMRCGWTVRDRDVRPGSYSAVATNWLGFGAFEYSLLLRNLAAQAVAVRVGAGKAVTTESAMRGRSEIGRGGYERTPIARPPLPPVAAPIGVGSSSPW
ncbi:MAG: hypothetical protein JWP63_4905 [Candidatus Solibacter sp.]|jgi:hypothetical protein|nr:hypothetical protein [Candidatus Solibacter sp.]